MSKGQISIIDSHTGGEPTRTIVSGGPDLGLGSMAQRRDIFQRNFDHIRRALLTEPRGSNVMVGALLCEPTNVDCAAGVIFFNNVGFLNMCGHGAIGVAVTLFHLGRIGLGSHRLETPVGEVKITLTSANQVTIENVPSYRLAKEVVVNVPGIGSISGDIAWGGNWFYLIKNHGKQLILADADRLIDYCWRVRQALATSGITGKDGALIDHIELFASASNPNVADSQNFVLCPGREYDRSPCGTGTSAKLACLYADGELSVDQLWRQESIIGSVFEGRIKLCGEQIIPQISGQAFVNLKAEVIIDPQDPFAYGF